MIEQRFCIINKLGMHARAAAKLVTTASAFKADISISHNQHIVNGKSIMGLMMLAAAKGSTITVRAEGEDEAAALAQIEALINDYFGESE